MLLYQYTLNKEKNFYVWAIPLSLFFGFVYGGTLQALDLFQLHKWMNNLYLSLLDYLLGISAYWATGLFRYLQRQQKN